MIGKIFVEGVKGPYRHPKVWTREATDGPERLRIGSGLGTIELVRALAGELAEPLSVLVVLHAPRAGDAVRLESPPASQTDLRRFLDRFGELFEDDARAQLWIARRDGEGMLVLDEHDLIYAYGPLDRFERLLRERGYADGDPAVPERHEHRSAPAFDPAERELRAYWRWRSQPLAPEERIG